MRAPAHARPEPVDTPLILSLSKDERLAQEAVVEGRARSSTACPEAARGSTGSARASRKGSPRAWFRAVLPTFIVISALSLSAQDWPQFLGPQRNGVYGGPPLATKWPAGGPRKVWQTSVGTGFAGPVVVGDRVVLFHRVADEEVVDALDAKTLSLIHI